MNDVLTSIKEERNQTAAEPAPVGIGNHISWTDDKEQNFNQETSLRSLNQESKEDSPSNKALWHCKRASNTPLSRPQTQK